MSPCLTAYICSAVVLTAALKATAHGRPIDAWSDFNSRVTTRCPALKFESKPAGDVNFLQERFYVTLSSEENRVFERAVPRVNGGPRACAERNGISCPTAWNMLALEKAGLLPRFAAFACANGGSSP